jgi:zinc transport system substrate-binding protein
MRGARWRIIVLAVLVAQGVTGCRPESPISERPGVAVTVLPLAGIVDRIAPGLVDVTVMIPAGASPVSHEPALSDLTAASRAVLYVEVGHPAFTWERTWIADLVNGSGANRVSAAAGCPIEREDPHVWLSTECVRSTARDVASHLSDHLPGREAEIAAALADFLRDVEMLEAESEQALAPHSGAAFVTLHPAWGYLVRRYGIEQISILEHGSGDAGPGNLAAIISRSRALGRRNVIVQPQFTSGPARLVAGELGGSVVEADPLARNWVASVRHIIRVIAREVSS